MKQHTPFWIGVIVGAILAAMLLFSVWYVPRKGLSFGKDPFQFTVVLDEANGLRAGSPVLVAGIAAGEVRQVELRELGGAGWKVLADIEIFDGARFEPMLRTDSVYQVSQSGLLGEMTLAIAPGGRGESARGALVDGVAPTSMSAVMDDLGRISKRVADFMDGREPGDPNLRRTLIELQEGIRNVRDFSEKLPR